MKIVSGIMKWSDTHSELVSTFDVVNEHDFKRLNNCNKRQEWTDCLRLNNFLL